MSKAGDQHIKPLGICARGLLFVLIFTLLFSISVVAGAYKKVVRVGWPEQPCYQETRSDGTHYGYTYEYLQDISKYTGWEYEFVEEDFSTCYEMLLNGEIDVMGCMALSEDRTENLERSAIEEGVSYNSIVVKNDSPVSYGDYEAIDGFRIGVGEGQNYTALMEISGEKNFTVEPVIYSGYREIMSAIQSGEVDAGSVGGYIPDDMTKSVADFNPWPFYFYVPKDSTEVLDGLNSAMDEIRLNDVFYNEKLNNKYISSNSSSIILTDEEKAYIDANPVISVEYNASWQPFEYKKDGEFAGAVADIFSRIETLTGLEFQYYSGQKNANGADIISSMFNNFEIATELGYNLTSPFISTPLVHVTSPGAAGKTAVVYLNYAYDSLEALGYDFIFYDNAEECLEAVRNGEVSGAIINSYVAQSIMQGTSKYKDLDVDIVSDVIFELSAAVRSDMDPLLFSIIDKAISHIPETEINNLITQNTLQTQKTNFFDVLNSIPSYIVIIIALFLLFVILGMLWLLHNRSVNLKTIQKLLFTDELTGLLSRRGFERKAKSALENAPVGRKYALVAFDVNSFNAFNETNGTSAGDDVLRYIADVLKRECKEDEVCARYSADNFAVLAEGRDFEAVKRKILSLDAKLSNVIQGRKILISYGVRMVDDKTSDINKHYDRAVVAKDSIKGNYDQFIAEYNDEMYQRLLKDADLVSRFDEAMENGEFLVYYQPQYDTLNQSIVGAEALVRWKWKGGDIIPPGRFIELFEHNGLVVRLDFYIFEQVCRQMALMRGEGNAVVPISVNMSRAHMFDTDLVEKLLSIAKDYGVDPGTLEIELTESAFMAESAKVVGMVDSLRGAGFKVSIDDFGSGYSSLNLLKDVSLDALKMDMRFLEGFEKGGKVGTVVTSVVRMAKWLKLPIVAEGVEDKTQFSFLKSIGCDIIQGYYFAKPMPVPDFEELIKNKVHFEEKEDLPDLYQGELNELMGGSRVISKIMGSLTCAFALYEYFDGNLEAIRMNDVYLNIIGDGDGDRGMHRNVLDNFVEEDRDRARAVLKKTISTGEAVRLVIHRRNSNGDIQALDSVICRIGGSDDRPIICISFDDITGYQE